MADVHALTVNLDTTEAQAKIEGLTQDVLRLQSEISRALAGVDSLRTALHSLTPGSRFPLQGGHPL